MKLQDFLFTSRAPAATILVRLMVGGVFLSEGIQKFLFRDALGVGRFAKIGIPYPEVMAPFVGICEIACGSLLIPGLLTRLAAIPMIINISVGDPLDQDSDAVGTRLLDVQSTQGRSGRLLGNGPRSPH